MIRAGIAALAMLVARSAAPGEERRMDVKAIRYISTAEDELYPIVLSIGAGGQATLTFATNAVDPKGRPVGIFAGVVAASDVVRIAEALSAPALQAPPPADAQPTVPGDAFRAFTLTWADGRVIRCGALESEDTPPPFAEAEAVVSRAIEAIAKNPVRALLLEVRRVEHLRKPERLELEIELLNRGREAVRIPRLDAPEPSVLVLDVTREQPEIPDQTFVEPRAKDVVAVPAPGPDGFDIPPGGAVRLRVSKKVPLKTGVYTVQALLRTRLAGPGDQPALRGEVRSPIVSLRF